MSASLLKGQIEGLGVRSVGQVGVSFWTPDCVQAKLDIGKAPPVRAERPLEGQLTSWSRNGGAELSTKCLKLIELQSQERNIRSQETAFPASWWVVQRGKDEDLLGISQHLSSLQVLDELTLVVLTAILWWASTASEEAELSVGRWGRNRLTEPALLFFIL